MKNKLKVGDVVVLKNFEKKTTNPQMTVYKINGEYVICHYYSPAVERINRIRLHCDQLTKIKGG